MDLFTDEPRPEQSEDIPQTEDMAIALFLNRWAFNWRGERAVIERELRELIHQWGPDAGART